MKLHHLQIQRTIFAPSIQQSINILILPIADLSIAIEEELQNNPLLEIPEDRTLQPPLSDSNLFKKIEASKEVKSKFEETADDGDNLEEKPIPEESTLEDSLIQQLKCEISDPLKIRIGEFIIGNIDEDGYLKVDRDEIARAAETGDLDLVEDVLKMIQNFEPSGIAARDLKECLSIQMKAKYNGKNELGCRIIDEYLEDLGSKKYLRIAKKLGISEQEVKLLAADIISLEPKPARNYRPLDPTIYIKPDVILRKDPVTGYQIHVNRENIPVLRINPFYKGLLTKPSLTEEEKKFIRERLKNALQFIKSIEQRNQTIYRITEYIVKKQTHFLDGAHFSIVPMTLKDVAGTIDRNESTVCRAINNKYIDTPQGIFPFKFFFSAAILTDGHTSVSTRGVKEEIKELVETEDKGSPLSDDEIQKHFKQKGISLARRTVSKYRKNLKILPSYLRRIS